MTLNAEFAVPPPPVPRIAALLARLTNECAAPDPSEGARDAGALTPSELGTLWPAVARALREPSLSSRSRLAYSIAAEAKRLGMMPRLGPEDCLALVTELRSGPRGREEAIGALTYLDGNPPAALANEIGRILGDASTWAQKPPLEGPWVLPALARWADADTARKVREHLVATHARSLFLLKELEAAESLAARTVLELARPRLLPSWPGFEFEQPVGIRPPDPVELLANDPAYVQLAHDLLRAAVVRIEDIYAGRIAYVADGAFTVDDSPSIARAAQVAALHDEPWLGELIETLLPKACVAPTSAATVPSQSVAIALGHAIERYPTPESVRALRTALAEVRHAGLKKKLSRHLKPAQQGLASRPEVALRLLMDTTADKAVQQTLKVCLEAGFVRGLELSWPDWRNKFARTPNGRLFATALIWTATTPGGSPAAFMLDAKGAEGAPIRHDGTKVEIDEASSIRLWHPLLASEKDRDEWRDFLTSRRIRQPIRQAFREFYVADHTERSRTATRMFAGYALALRPLLGLVRREGWKIDRDEGLVRRFGELRAALGFDTELYPGAAPSVETVEIRLQAIEGRGWKACRLQDVEPVVLSEVCRAVDLLVSVASVAVNEPGEAPPEAPRGTCIPVPRFVPMDAATLARWKRIEHLAELNRKEMMLMRQAVLRRAFEQPIAEGRVRIGDRHAEVGEFRVHLATARSTRAGEPVDLDLGPDRKNLRAIPWLPYDEVLLERVADAICMLLERQEGSR